MFAIISKEFKTFFQTMVGFAFIGFYLLILGIYFYAYHLGEFTQYTSFQAVMSSMSIFFIIFIPLLSIKGLSDETRNKTDQLLITSPISVEKVVIGKYLGTLSVFGVAMVATLFYPLFVGSMAGKLMNYGVAYYSILGYTLLGAAYLAIGLFISSLTESMGLSLSITFVIVLLTTLLSNFASKIPGEPKNAWIILAVILLLVAIVFYTMVKEFVVAGTFAVISQAVIAIIYFVKPELYDNVVLKLAKVLSVSAVFDNFIAGNFYLTDIIYYLSIIVIFVFLTIQQVKKRRWN